MKRVLTAAEMRAVDSASADHGVPGSVLMENAGDALTRAARREAGEGGRFFVLCGVGNNGGDGFVVARRLAAQGRQVWCEVVGDVSGLKGDALRSFSALGSAPGPIIEAPRAGDVVVDALFGTGLSRAPTGPFATAIERIAAWRLAGARVVAADLPSGLDSDAGTAPGACVTADVTVSFGFAKLGQVIEPGASFSGRLEIVDIGIPAEAERQALPAAPTFLLEEADVRARVPKREAQAHKGTAGNVLVIGGSVGKTGAAALTALGALRGGAGLVSVATQRAALGDVLRHAPELMGVPLDHDGGLGLDALPSLIAAADGKDAVVFGPGLARGPQTHLLLGAMLERLQCPFVIDADGLNALAGHLEVLARAEGELVLTPHPGEMARLVEQSTAELQRNRVTAARTFATTHRVALVLKGARTVVGLPDGAVFINPTGNPGMATGGTGDVLAGLVGALLAQGLRAGDAAVVAPWVHGRAGDLASVRRGELGLIASDLLDGMTEVWRSWGR